VSLQFSYVKFPQNSVHYELLKLFFFRVIQNIKRGMCCFETQCMLHVCNCYRKVGKLKTLRSYMDVTEGNVPVTVCKLAMLSLMEVFKDVLPEYRIRVFTNTEKRQKVCC